jgi:hypothetical protein
VQSYGPVRKTPTTLLADHLLPGGLETFVRDRRARGMSWRRITLEIRDVTDRAVDVTHQTLYLWFRDENGEAA